MTEEPRLPTEEALNRLEARSASVLESLWDDFVDPRDAYAGPDGETWRAVGNSGSGLRGAAAMPELEALRDECRGLAALNEFAINGHENRVSYVVGSGHQYLATIRKGVTAPLSLAQQTQAVIDEFLEQNSWHDRQQEALRRMDRDGEVFLRYFFAGDGSTQVRFIEPEQVFTPPERAQETNASHGILTEPNDVEAVVGYYVDGGLVDASQVQHRKANVDRNVKRGLPLYTPVRSNLRRAARLLRNMSVVAEIQSAIALIRKHRTATRTGVEQFVSNATSAGPTDRRGKTRRVMEYGPGTILDAPAGLEYDFPATGVDAGSYVAILQAELRAIAARLIMPEFMFTSDASNANFSSTLVAEGPAMKMFDRLQASIIGHDRRVLRVVLEHAAAVGRLPTDALQSIELQIIGPSLRVRDRLQETQIDEIAFRHGVLSRQTWSQRLGLDYEQERANLAQDLTRSGPNR